MGGIPNNRFVISERREKVHAMLSQGLNEIEIAKVLNVGQSTICRDIKSIKKDSQKSLESVVKEVLPYEYSKSILCMDLVIRECWTIIKNHTGQYTIKNKLDALKLLKESTITKLEILITGPINLRAQDLEKKVKDLVEKNDMPRKSFFTLGPPPNSYEDLR